MAEYIDRGIAIAKLTALEIREPHATLTDAKWLLADMPAVSVPQWISVKDRLPKYENPVLAGNAELCFVNTAWYHVETKRWEFPSGIFCEVTHWMPLPEPPKGEKDD